MEAYSPSGANEPFFKVAIPRLARPRPKTSAAKALRSTRAQKACRSCHKRKVKCSGGTPKCEICEKSDRKCVYDEARRDRLADALNRNENLAALLLDLKTRVTLSDRTQIEAALCESDDANESGPATPSKDIIDDGDTESVSSKRGSASTESSSSPKHPSGCMSTVSDMSSAPDSLTPHKNLADRHRPSLEGQTSEIRWLHSLQHRLGATDRAEEATHPSKRRKSEFGEVIMPTIQGVVQQHANSNYFLDDDGIDIAAIGNPFKLPSEPVADALFQCYTRTVHSSFPLLPANIGSQLRMYYQLAQTGQSAVYPPKWFAIINATLAIGSQFCHISGMPPQGDKENHKVFASRALQLLDLNNTAMVLRAPNLLTIQTLGLIGFYYMAIGHPQQSWLICETAMKFAISLGLHVQHSDPERFAHENGSMLRTWWSLRSLQTLLSSMLGRPSTIDHESITTPRPSHSIIHPNVCSFETVRHMTFLDANAGIGDLVQKVMSNLYTQRRYSQSLSEKQSNQRNLMGRLDSWALAAIPHNESQMRSSDPKTQREWLLLRYHYYRTLILITQPSLDAVMRSSFDGITEIASFDQSTAEACIQAAQGVTSLVAIETSMEASYERRPWWSIVHNIMQAMAVLMSGLSLPGVFLTSAAGSAVSIKILVGWLRAMRDSNLLAQKAYEIIYHMVRKSPLVWYEIAESFPDEVFATRRPSFVEMDDTRYFGWAGKEDAVHPVYGYQLSETSEDSILSM